MRYTIRNFKEIYSSFSSVYTAEGASKKLTLLIFLGGPIEILKDYIYKNIIIQNIQYQIKYP